MARELAAVLFMACAIALQYVFTGIDLGGAVRAWLSSLAEAAVEPERPPVRMGVAKSEADINAQQALSASRLAELVADADVPAPQPDDVRRNEPSDVIRTDLVMRCGEKLPPESAWTTRGVEIFVKSSFQGTRGDDHQWKYTVTFTNRGADTVQMLSRR